MAVQTKDSGSGETIREYASLNAEAKRLIDFKKKHVRKRDQTACPQCATLIKIHAKKCPHCGSDIAKHTEKIRKELGKLMEITGELHELHERYMECYEEASTAQPFLQRVKDFFSDPRLREDLKIILPSFLLFFVVISALKLMGNGPLFWGITLPSAFIAYYLLRRSTLRKGVTIDLYRVLFIVGLILVVAGPATPSLSGWFDFSSNTVEVQPLTANIRASSSTDSQIVTRANRGDKLEVLGRQGDWYNVKTKDGQEGWVYASLVRE